MRDARRAIANYAETCGFDKAAVDEIALAAGEALANAVEHGTKAYGFIDIACSFDGEELSVEVSDGGSGFDVEHVTKRGRDPESIRGFGLSIMHAVMDRVQFEGSGATVRLRKRHKKSASHSDAGKVARE